MAINTSQLVKAMSEQSIVDQALLLLQEMQTLMTTFTDTTDKLIKHDSDVFAHMDIRDTIQGIVTGEGLVTREAMFDEIAKAIDSHDTAEHTHMIIRQSIQTLIDNFDKLSKRVAALEPTSPDIGLSELEKKLKAIDEYYDPTLAALMEAWNVAKMNNTGTADAIAAEYQKLSQEKAQAIATVMKEYAYA